MLFDVCLAEGEAQRVDIHSCQGAEQGHGREGMGTNKEKPRKDNRESVNRPEKKVNQREREGRLGRRRERGVRRSPMHTTR